MIEYDQLDRQLDPLVDGQLDIFLIYNSKDCRVNVIDNNE